MATNYGLAQQLTPSIQISTDVFPQQGEEVNHPIIEAFSSMYNNYGGKIFRYILYRVGEDKTAEDLTSLVFMKAWEKIHRNEIIEDQYVSWLFIIARNTIIDHYRTRKETVALDTSIKETSDHSSPEELSVSHFEEERLRQAIQRLTKEQRNVVVLKFIHGMSTEEIAIKLGKRTGTVRPYRCGRFNRFHAI